MAPSPTPLQHAFTFWDEAFLAALTGFSRRREYQRTFPIDLVEDAAAVATSALDVRLRTQRELADTLDLDGQIEPRR